MTFSCHLQDILIHSDSLRHYGHIEICRSNLFLLQIDKNSDSEFGISYGQLWFFSGLSLMRFHSLFVSGPNL